MSREEPRRIISDRINGGQPFTVGLLSGREMEELVEGVLYSDKTAQSVRDDADAGKFNGEPGPAALSTSSTSIYRVTPPAPGPGATFTADSFNRNPIVGEYFMLNGRGLDIQAGKAWLITSRVISNLGNMVQTYIHQVSEITGGPRVVQSTGTSTEDVMSQNATTQAINNGAVHSARIHVSLPDEVRDINSPPLYYMNMITTGPINVIEFKHRSAIGMPGSSTFVTLETTAPWPDAGGGLPSQIGTAPGAVKYIRYAVNTATWSNWAKIPTKLLLKTTLGTLIPHGSLQPAEGLRIEVPLDVMRRFSIIEVEVFSDAYGLIPVDGSLYTIVSFSPPLIDDRTREYRAPSNVPHTEPRKWDCLFWFYSWATSDNILMYFYNPRLQNLTEFGVPESSHNVRIGRIWGVE